MMGRVHAALDRRKAAYEAIKTPEDVAARQKRMREFFLAQLGGFPQRTPLNAQVVGHLKRDGYRIEKIIYESQPRHYVTALLYLPDAKPPYPGVLVPCGHSNNGKAVAKPISVPASYSRETAWPPSATTRSSKASGSNCSMPRANRSLEVPGRTTWSVWAASCWDATRPRSAVGRHPRDRLPGKP